MKLPRARAAARAFRPSPRLVAWAAVTACTALVSRWVSTTLMAYPAARESGPSAARNPAAARDEQRLADTPLWPVVESAFARRAVRPLLERSPFGGPGARALNVDCGPGGVAIAVRQALPPHALVVATDPVAGMCDLAALRARRRGAGLIAYVRALPQALPFLPHTFDLVTAAGTVHGWTNPEPPLAELSRVLRPDGHYLIGDLRRTVPPALWLLVRLAQALVVPRDLRSLGEPGSSLAAAFSPPELEWLGARAKLPDLAIEAGPAWIMMTRGTAAPPSRRTGPR